MCEIKETAFSIFRGAQKCSVNLEIGNENVHGPPGTGAKCQNEFSGMGIYWSSFGRKYILLVGFSHMLHVEGS
jgi:hypothetical protein